MSNNVKNYWKHKKNWKSKRGTNRRTDGPTDRVTYRVACTRLETFLTQTSFQSDFFWSPFFFVTKQQNFQFFKNVHGLPFRLALPRCDSRFVSTRALTLIFWLALWHFRSCCDIAFRLTIWYSFCYNFLRGCSGLLVRTSDSGSEWRFWARVRFSLDAYSFESSRCSVNHVQSPQ